MTTRLWETDEEYSAAASAILPAPTDTPYRTPSRTSRASRRSKRSSNSPGPPSSSPPMPYGDMQNHRNSRDIANDESISILDPRRFTPTLHASLVSEILGLRRDQEEKIRFIESLESELHEARGVHENLEQTLAVNGKETRSLKRQLDLLEGGTSSALQELAKERDEAVDNAADIKRRLESAQKKQRSQEEDLDRTNELYSRDKENWDAERRKYERQIHVAEGRLKTVLDEVAAIEAARQEDAETEAQELANAQDLGNDNGNDNASVRSMSITHSRANSMRFSAMNGFGNGFKGVSLADELNIETDDDQETDYGGRESAMSNHKRHLSRESIISPSKHHKRNMSNDSLMRSKSASRGRYVPNQSAFAECDSGIPEETSIQPKPEYIDTGVQFSPPPSPKLDSIISPEVPEMSKPDLQILSEPLPRELEVEANQRRKRVHAPPLVLEPISQGISAGCQTLDPPLSPPRTPQSPTRAPPPPPDTQQNFKIITASISTQTDSSELEPPSPSRPAPQPPLLVPLISIHPPESRPTTPRGALLPAHFKNVGCQVFLPSSSTYCSSSMQTEEIRVDKRLGKLPAHLHPSAISSVPPTPERAEDRGAPSDFTPIPPKSPRRANSKSSVQSRDPPSSPPISSLQEAYDAYPGNNDDGPLSNGKPSNIRRPHRISSLFAGFDDKSSDDGDFAEGELSDGDFRTALSAPKPRSKSAKRTAGPTSVPEDEVLGDIRKLARPFLGERGSSKASSVVISTAKQGTMRKAALISSGVAAHASAPLSPSLEGDGHEPLPPPFPIPTRASSRQVPLSSSAPSDGRRSPTPGDPWSGRNGRGSGRGHSRSGSVRKVRSAAALPRNGNKYRRRGSRSPPPLSVSTEGPASPQLPPMPNNDITSPSPRFGNDFYKKSTSRHGQQPSTTTAHTEQSIGNPQIQTTSVVDSIAQTMVGEWMFKYVRRRKSFGVPDNNQVDDTSGNGTRHKRWVWLAPYERAVIWSSKQPTSGSALLGKSGRKLTIQSVLDVKDDNPEPKNTGGQTVFNRSILILTPARALKFTAINSERHYIWLTALSFLAHSSQAVPNIQVPPLPTQPFEIPLKSAARLRRNPIRDSIRVAKGKTSPNQLGPQSVGGSSSQYGGSTQGDNVSSILSPALTETSFASQQQSHHGHIRDDSVVSGVAVPRYGGRGERDYREHDKERGYQSSYSTQDHSRKRSNTTSRIAPPLSFRGFSGPGPSTTTASQFGVPFVSGHAPQPSIAGMSVGTNGSSDIYGTGSTYGGTLSTGTAPTYQMSVSGISSIRTSDVSGSTRPGAVVNNFFDAVGTMRMEAFISPMALIPTENNRRFGDHMNGDPLYEGMGMNFSGTSEKSWGSGGGWGAALRDKDRDRSGRRRKSKHRDSYYGNSRKMAGGSKRDPDDFYGGSKTAGEEDFREPTDPFRGF